MQELTIPQPATAQPEKATGRFRSILVYAIAGWSGYFVMSTELLAGRVVAPFFGGSIYVWGAVITVFMLALALGYLVGGRLSLRNPDLRRLGALLAIAALSALPVVLFGEPLLEAISESVPDPRYGTLLACIALFFLPTLLSGMVSPYAVRLLVTQASTSGASAGWLYFVSTFGSAAGTILTSFYLVLLLEVNEIILIMIGVSLAIGALPLLARKFHDKALLVLGLLVFIPTFPVEAETVLHEERSLYRNIIVYQEGQQRCLKFGRKEDARQTCRMQNDPDQLIFSYTRLMMASLYLNPSPKHVLVIGLGGGTLPGAIRTVVPTAQIDVVEIDPAVTRVAYKYFGFAPGTLTQVHEQDGRVFVKKKLREKASYDLVMLDAFTDQYIPEHLLTQEFLQEVKGVMSPNGVLAANTFSTSGLYHHESATYASVFGRFFGLKTNSRVILTRLGSMPTQQELRANAAAVEAKLQPMGTGSDYLLPKFEIETGWPRGTRVLTDQYSPANLLNLR